MATERVEGSTPRKPLSDFTILEQVTPTNSNSEPSSSSGSNRTKRSAADEDKITTLPLTTSRLGNYQANQHNVPDNESSPSKKQRIDSLVDHDKVFSMDKLFAHLGHAKKSGHAAEAISSDAKKSNTGVLQSSAMTRDDKDNTLKFEKEATPGADKDLKGPNAGDGEVHRLKRELEAAKDKIAAMDHELAQQRITNHSIDQVLRSPSGANFKLEEATEELMNKLQHSPGYTSLQTVGAGRKTSGGSASTQRTIESFGGVWDETTPGPLPYVNSYVQAPPSWNANPPSAWSGQDARNIAPTPRMPNAPQPQRPTNLRVDTFEANQHGSTAIAAHGYDPAYRQSASSGSRPGSAMGGQFYHGMSSYPGSAASTGLGFSPPMTPMQYQQMNQLMAQGQMPYRPRPIGTPLSPTAMEFNSGDMTSMNSFQAPPWANQGATENSSGYMPPAEPMNYRRLLDRNMSCNWKYIVDKIVCSNDQQASIFLQQKLKIAAPEQKFELVEAIIAQAYPLMINRFGNFLVQRCFEHGTPEQVIAVANAIRGNTLNLSMDAFGCHVVQKAFDVVPEEYKAIMVHELLRRIPETVIHRYACHVWQKLFELRWSDSPPQIMKYVNEALRGMWHEVALGETGSLVVQNIFENCLEEDKRPCINEVLASIDIIAHGQFGNWCIQHICEHGLPADRSRAVEHVLRYATEYSTDQFASKVVEKCLKIGGTDFMDRYLERVCEGRADRPRMPLIDIAGDQYGNYLIQYILIHANPHHREVVCTHVRKHMVSLRGSKFGSRVAMLCSNPAFATRPGPPAGMQMHPRYPPPGIDRGPMGPPFR